jgi:hypothetical protein
VPRVFDRIYAGINDNLAGNFLKRLLFMACLARKKAFMMAGSKHDAVGGGFRAVLGFFCRQSGRGGRGRATC